MSNNSLNSSVYIKLCGGLCNQLFQIANGYAYSLRHNKNFYVSKTWDGIKPERPSYWDSLLKNLQPYLKDISEFKGITYKEPHFKYKPIPIFEGDLILEGYFQSEKYFEDHKEDIRKLLDIYPKKYTNSVPVIGYNICQSMTIAIHIRRGDYLAHPEIHNILTKEYYDEAKKIIEDKLGFRPIYKYFSEDTEWVKETFKDDLSGQDMVVTPISDIEDFQEMINCDHFILANSTFGWWTSWLADLSINLESKESLDQIVIAPKKWFGVFMKQQGQDWSFIYRNNWIII